MSTADQSLGQQEEALRGAGCEVVFVEKVGSGVPSHKRPQLVACLEELVSGDVLVVTRLDRLGRTQSEVVSRLDELMGRGVHVETLDGLLNTAALGAMAPLFIGVISGLSHVERNLTRERTRENYEHRRRTGGKLGGRPPVPPEKRDLALRLREEGMSIRRIASALGISSSAVHRLVSSQPG